MFDLLTRYLLEQKKMSMPRIGVFELIEKKADVDYAAETIAPPVWQAVFICDKNIDLSHSEQLIRWISLNEDIAHAEAQQRFEHFVGELRQRLSNGEKIDWERLGWLEETDGEIVFTPHIGSFSPFTGVTAKKIAREELSSHETLVGNHITTTAEMREKLNGRGSKPGSNRLMWALLGVALLAAAWYFSQNGCNKQATGNRQPVQTTAPGETYKIQ